MMPASAVNEFIRAYLTDAPTVKTNKKIEYFNTPAAFDIETSSFYENGEKRGIMYEWTLGINSGVIYGRTWDEFLTVLTEISTAINTHTNRRLIVFVHNLAYEFQFMRKYFEWEKVFAVKDRKPVQALTDFGIEFRCSYILSGYSLATVGKNLAKYKIKKAVGDLDYRVVRTSRTPLTSKELYYCENDVRVVMAYIAERIEEDGDISRIPLTKTGYVRNYCRKSCMRDRDKNVSARKYREYRVLMRRLSMSTDEYAQLKRAFQGGFTHACAFYARKTLFRVASKDITSSYPTVMVAEQFPMSGAEIVDVRTKKEFDENLSLYCCLFDITFEGIEATVLWDHPISSSRCWAMVGEDIDNGRVVSAKSITTTITEQDYYIISKFYRWDKMKIGTFRRYKRGYLPTDFVRSVLALYEAKTRLKGVDGMEQEYARAKEMINSCFGMCCTDPCREDITYTDEWGKTAPNIDEQIQKHNESKKRFLFFAWGVWITAYARRNLFSAIMECGEDYIYSDTDSVKIKNAERHKPFFDRYNATITRKIEIALEKHGIPSEMAHPKTVKGVEKPLGVWDDDGTYQVFRTLGAKRYMVKSRDGLSITVSGVNKANAVPYLISTYGKYGAFTHFDDELFIPASCTGKLTHTYVDEEIGGEVVDYLGVKASYHERSFIHLEEAAYSLSMSDRYIDFINGVQEFYK